MGSTIDLTQGSISKGLLKMALPVMGTSFLQLAYNLTDMFWLGKKGSGAVAAVGSAGFYIWLSFAFIMISKIGAEVKISHMIGAKKIASAKEYANSAIQLTLILAIMYSICIYIFRGPLIGFFNLKDPEVISMAKSYLGIVSFGMFFSFLNPVLTGIFNGYGDTKTPFFLNTIGLITNIILDPLLIFGVGPIPALEVKGAAIATLVSHMAVSAAFILYIKGKKGVVKSLHPNTAPKWSVIKEHIQLGTPVAIHSSLFTLFTMVIARIVAQWGPEAIAVQKVGSQIEAISWMTASGFQVAMAGFVGQNYGADQPERIIKGYKSGMLIISAVGIFATFLFFLKAKPIFSQFIPEEKSILYGVSYLKILAYSQLFMCIELVTAGAFNGLGKTAPPSVISGVFNALRIPMALVLSRETLLGLDGIWWTFTITSVIKGLLLTGWFLYFIKKQVLFNVKDSILSQQELTKNNF